MPANWTDLTSAVTEFEFSHYDAGKHDTTKSNNNNSAVNQLGSLGGGGKYYHYDTNDKIVASNKNSVLIPNGASKKTGEFSLSVGAPNTKHAIIPVKAAGPLKDPDQLLILTGWRCVKDKPGLITNVSASTNDLIVVYSLDGIEVPRCHKLT